MASKLAPPGTWQRTRHHAFLGTYLARKIAAGNARIAIHAPPRHGKSQLVSKHVTPWALSLWPWWKCQLASYEAQFARTWGRASRDLILEHPELGVTLRKGRSAAEGSWETVEGGGLHTAGVGGPLTGRGANLLIIDDPIKNAREAFSPIVRQAHWDWFQTTAMTRLEPGASVIVMMTRWHKDDLVGRLIARAKEGGEPWEYVCLPAIAHPGDPLGRRPGEALWPERYSLADLRKIEIGRGLLAWAAMYDGDPKSAAGGMFAREDFRVVDAAPFVGFTIRSWDFASTDPTELDNPEEPDWTVGVKMLLAMTGEVFVLDVIRVRVAPGAKKRLVVQTAIVDGKLCQVVLQQDPGQAGVDQIAEYARALAGFRFWSAPPTGDKTVRADPYASQVKAGNVFLVNGPWVREFLDEHEDFPLGSFDDQVDAASWGYSHLAASGGRLLDADDDEEPRRRPDHDPFDEMGPRKATDDEDEEDDGTWRTV